VPGLALHSGRLNRFEFEQLLTMLPVSSHCIRDWVDPRSESLLESVARVRLLRHGFRVESQVAVGDLGTIDLVVGDHIALELDGREFHGVAFERDRRKDLQITLERRHCIRASYSMVRDEWKRIEASILAALGARGLTPRQYSVDSPREPTGRQHAHGAGRGLD
jgi:hypothetical protein